MTIEQQFCPRCGYDLKVCAMLDPPCLSKESRASLERGLDQSRRGEFVPDPLSSNPQFSPCKHGVYGLMPHACGICLGEAYERLTAELQWMTLDRDAHKRVMDAAIDRADRLRAALEQLDEGLAALLTSEQLRRIIRKALAGGADETSAVPAECLHLECVAEDRPGAPIECIKCHAVTGYV